MGFPKSVKLLIVYHGSIIKRRAILLNMESENDRRKESLAVVNHLSRSWNNVVRPYIILDTQNNTSTFFCCYLYAFSPFLIEFADSAEMDFRMVPGQSCQRPQGASGCFYMLPGFRTAHPECNQTKNRNRQKPFRW